ncbi:MAG TPA: Fic family protein [Acidimicrobiales bacterium]|nr:Fic family protein [Acidimicrobiales bacterium]
MLVRNFIDLATRLAEVPGPVVSRLRQVDRGAGREDLYADQAPGLLDQLATRARVESVTASSAIEGVVVEPGRASRILAGQVSRLGNRSEQELAGYRDALDHLWTDDPGELTVGLILHLHRLLFARTESPGGRLKDEDNLVVDIDESGVRTVRFRPVSARETPYHLEELVTRYGEAQRSGLHHPVLLVGMFALDLSIIHPFTDGNGRVLRVLTNYLLVRSGYSVTRYVSLEQLLHDDRDRYYDALAASTTGWSRDESNVWPWLDFFVEKLELAYRIFEAQATAARGTGTKQDRVREHIRRHAPASFAMADLRAALPGISDVTIRLVLAELRSAGEIAPDGTGRSTRWRRLGR